MPAFLFADNARTSLGQAIGPSLTTITLAAGGGQAFPSPAAGQQFALTINDLATRAYYEVCYCTARAGDVLTVVRGQEGTTAKSWNIGDYVWCGPTAGQMAAMVQTIHMTDATISPVFSNTTVQGWIQGTNYIDTTNQVRASTGFISRGFDPWGQFRAIGGSYGAFLRNDGGTVYLLQTNANDQYGGWNNFRPFYWNLSSGAVSIDGTGAGTNFGGNISTNATMSAGALSCSGNAYVAGYYQGGNVSVNGNVWGAGWVASNFVWSNGDMSAAGTLTAANVNVTNNVNAANASIASNIWCATLYATNISASNNITAAAEMYCYGLSASHDVSAAGAVIASAVYATNQVNVGGWSKPGGWSSIYVEDDDWDTVFAYGWGYYTKWIQNQSRYQYVRSDNTELFFCDNWGNFYAHNSISAPNICDERAKRNVRPYQRGLAEIVQFEPVAFEYNGEGDTHADGRTHYGVSAQRAQAILPESVRLVSDMEPPPHDKPDFVSKRLPDMLSLEEKPVLWALVNAAKEMAARISELETEVRTLKEKHDERPAEAAAG